MQITSFNPLIVSQHADEIVALFEELGFEPLHTMTGIGESNVTNFDLMLDDKFRVDVAKSTKIPQDMTVIRMNVRDFDEAHDFLVSKGFKDIHEGDAIDTGSGKTTLLVSPSGFAINLSLHIRKD